MGKLIAEFDIMGLPMMTNKIGGSHWTKRHKEAVKWKRAISAHCAQFQISGLGLDKASLTLTRHSSKEPDMDGLVSGFKHVIDGLVMAGVIIDDKPSVIGQSQYRWLYRPTKHGGMISVKIEA